MSTTTKKELIDRIAENTQAKRALVKATVQNFFNEIISELAKGNRLEFRDFGVFEPRDCVPRTAQNPKTLERIHVPCKRVVKFLMRKSYGQSFTIRRHDLFIVLFASIFTLLLFV